MSAINNWAFSFNIPLTLHIVFRAGSLVTNLLMSKLILKRNFSTEKYISVATITCGIIICTLVSTDSSKAVVNEQSSTELAQGLIVMTIGLLLSSLIGICQEKTRFILINFIF